MKTFNNAFELASYIKANFPDPFQSESLMRKALDHKKHFGTYTLII